MYILTELGTSTIAQLKVPHKQHFERIWELFEKGNKHVVENKDTIRDLINKYDTGRWTRTFYNSQKRIRLYTLAPEYWKWEK